MHSAKTSLRATRWPRRLLQELRSLAALVELTNLISQAELGRFCGAYLRLFEKEYGSRSTRQRPRSDDELMAFMKKFSARCRAPERGNDHFVEVRRLGLLIEVLMN